MLVSKEREDKKEYDIAVKERIRVGDEEEQRKQLHMKNQVVLQKQMRDWQLMDAKQRKLLDQA